MKFNTVQNVLSGHFSNSAHLYRQIFATVAASLLSISGGIVFGNSAVLLPQLKNDTSFPYDAAYDSWIAAISPLAMISGCFFSGGMSDGIGRRMGSIVLNVPYLIGWLIMGFSNSNTMLLIGRFIIGVCAGATRSNSLVYIGEIVDPKYRTIALLIPSLAVYTGSLVSHTVGKYVYWQTSCFLFMIPNFLTLMMLLFFKESPLWLLAKGKIDDGKDSFISFRGNSESSERELTLVLKRCNEKTNKISFKDILNLIFSKPFMRSLLTIFVLFVAVQWSGINTLSFYAQDIFEKTFSGKVDGFLLMIVTDCIRIIACLINCIFFKFLPRKMTFIICCFASSSALLALTIYLYLQPTGLVWLAILCLCAYIALTTALTSISWTFIVEIYPGKLRGFGSGMSSGISFSLLFFSVIATPRIMARFGETALFAGFAAVTLVTGTCLHFLIPDTNSKCLQDIEDTLYKKKRIEYCNEIDTAPSIYTSHL